MTWRATSARPYVKAEAPNDGAWVAVGYQQPFGYHARHSAPAVADSAAAALIFSAAAGAPDFPRHPRHSAPAASGTVAATAAAAAAAALWGAGGGATGPLTPPQKRELFVAQQVQQWNQRGADVVHCAPGRVAPSPPLLDST
jgi:purine-cytosine permease-like protein